MHRSTVVALARIKIDCSKTPIGMQKIIDSYSAAINYFYLFFYQQQTDLVVVGMMAVMMVVVMVVVVMVVAVMVVAVMTVPVVSAVVMMS